jgi:hypothetical protein
VKIAREIVAASKMSHRHQTLYLDGSLLTKNIPSIVAKTDGLMSCFHTIGNTVLENVRTQTDVFLDGMQNLGRLVPVTLSSLSKFRFLEMYYRPMDLPVLGQILARPYLEGAREHRENFTTEISRRSRDGDILNIGEETSIRRQRRVTVYSHAVRRHYAEVRSPLFDYDLMDYITTVPSLLRAGNYVYLRAFDQMSPQLSRIAWEKTGLPIRASMPRVVIKKFLDNRRRSYKYPWYREMIVKDPEVQSFLADTLLDGCCVQMGLCRGDGVKAFVKRTFRHGTSQDVELMSRLVSLELWFRAHPNLLS